ncbi:MAG: hypothetical protein AAF908_01150, partial [Pseudomonadota bacterium]
DADCLLAARLGDLLGGLGDPADALGDGGERTIGIEEVAAAVGKLDDITQKNSALADQSATEATALTGQVEQLAQLSRAFKLGDTPQALASPDMVQAARANEAVLDADFSVASAEAPAPAGPSSRGNGAAKAAAGADWSEF